MALRTEIPSPLVFLLPHVWLKCAILIKNQVNNKKKNDKLSIKLGISDLDVNVSMHDASSERSNSAGKCFSSRLLLSHNPTVYTSVSKSSCSNIREQLYMKGKSIVTVACQRQHLPVLDEPRPLPPPSYSRNHPTDQKCHTNDLRELLHFHEILLEREGCSSFHPCIHSCFFKSTDQRGSFYSLFRMG